MSFAAVQVATTSNGSSSPTSIAMGSSVTAGSLLVLVWAGLGDGGAPTVTGVTDSQSGSWVFVTSAQDATFGYDMEIWACLDAPGGSTTVSVAATAASPGFDATSIGAWVREFSYSGTVTVDASGIISGSGATWTSPSLTPTAAGDLAVAAILDNGGTVSTFPSSPWSNDAGPDMYSVQLMPVSYALNIPAGAISATWTGPSGPYDGIGALFTTGPSGGGGGGGGGGTGPVGVAGSWVAGFGDEFNTGSVPNSTDWNVNWLGADNTVVTPPVNTQSEEQCYDPAQATVSAGSCALALIAKSQTVGGKAYPYSSGMINTHGKHTFTPPVFWEWRVFIPGSGQTVYNWPAVWSDPADLNWPQEGEIDVMEGLGGSANFNFHWGAAGTNGNQSGPTAPNPATFATGGSFVGWHTFGVYWQPGSLTYYYDGHNVGTVTNGVSSMGPQMLLANLATPNGPISIPSTMLIDYVRTWTPGTGAAPLVTTQAATAITASGATLNVAVTPNGSSTVVNFQYGTTTSYGSTVTSSPIGTGSTPIQVPATITGLAANTTYHFRATATNSNGTTNGSDLTFTTGAGSSAPTVTTLVANTITSNSATPTGNYNLNGLAGTVTFQYGLTTSYGSTATVLAVPPSPTSGGLATFIGGLTPGTTYHFRITATNSVGTTNGSDATFTTTASGLAAAATGAASGVSAHAATLNGTVTPNGADTTWQFVYGPTTSYGNQLPLTGLDAGAGTVPVPVSATLAGGLAPSTTYHYQLVAANANGTSHGADETFTTPAAVGAPIVATGGVDSITQTDVDLNATVNPNGQATTYFFEWGTTNAYGTSTTIGNLIAGSSIVAVNAALSGLSAGTTYHYRISATNPTGTAKGTDGTFTTQSNVGPPPPPTPPPTPPPSAPTPTSPFGLLVLEQLPPTIQ